MSLSLTVTSPFAPARTISYDECEGSPTETQENQTFQATRTFKMPWVDRWSFCVGMLGFSFPASFDDLSRGAVSYYPQRTVPIGYALTEIDNRTGDAVRDKARFLYPTSIRGMKGLGKPVTYDNQNVATYARAEVSLGYEALTYRIRTDDIMLAGGYTFPIPPGVVPPANFTPGLDESQMVRYITRFRQPTASYLTLPQGAMRWVEPITQLTPPGLIGKIIPATEIMYVWHQVPTVPLAIDTYIGAVNSAKFDNKQRGQLLLTSVDIKPYRWFFNQRMFDITYKMKFFSPDGGGIDTSTASTVLNNNNTFTNIPLQEYKGHNHFLRGYQNLDPGATKYQMVSSDGRAPPSTGVDAAGAKTGTTNLTPTTGRTIYCYADFKDLFKIEGLPVPEE